MTKKSDNNPTTPKKQHPMKTRKDNKKEKKDKRYKKNQSSDDDGELPSEEELDIDFDLELPSDIEDDNSLNDKKYQKFLAKMFPSTYMDKKVDALSSEDDDTRKPSKKKKKNKKTNKKTNKKKRQDKNHGKKELKKKSKDSHLKEKKLKNKVLSKKEESDGEDSEQDEALLKRKRRNQREKNRDKREKKKKRKDSSEEEDIEDDNDDWETMDEEDIEDDNEGYGDYFKDGNNKFNIVFTIGAPDDDYYDEEDEWDDEDEWDEEWEEEESEEEDDDESEEEEPKKRRSTNKRKKGKANKKSKDNEPSSEEEEDDEDNNENGKKKKKTKKEREKEKALDIEKEEQIIQDFKEQAQKMLEKNKNSDMATQMLKEVEKKEKDLKKKKKKLEKKTRDKNSKTFKKLLREKNMMNDIGFFKNKLSVKEQEKIIQEVEEVKKYSVVERPYRLQVLEANIPAKYKAFAMKKVNSLRYMEPGGGEYYKIKNWVDTFMQIPFGKTSQLPLSLEDGVDKCHEFMEQAKKTLDEAVFGLDDAKMQIMQMVGQWITNPNAVGTAIAIKGPMGTGKTTLVKEGISKILNREFAFIALGGATDSSFLEGHSYTYEGSTWGKIVEILIQCKTMNPVIYFDELDKISNTPKGEEIAGILTHLTDTTQNSQFHDKYFSEIDFDLSKCLFIFSYNHEEKVNPILRDRMYRIQTKGYDKKEKSTIANSYLLPKICNQVKFTKEDIIIPDETLHYMIQEFTSAEKGVRNMKRCLEIIYTKLNLYRLMKPGTTLFDKQQTLEVSFPFTVTKDVVDKLLKRDESGRPPFGMYI